MESTQSTENYSPELPSDKFDPSSVKELQIPGKLVDRGYKPLEYDPGLPIINRSLVRVKPGIVMKFPFHAWWLLNLDEIESEWGKTEVTWAKKKFYREKVVFEERLQPHPRIVEFLGIVDLHHGILLKEVSNGDLQEYVKNHGDQVNMNLRLKWRSQAAEAIEYIHRNSVRHHDLRPHNFLLDAGPNNELDLILCDFGCAALDDEEWPTCGPWTGYFYSHGSPTSEHQDLFGLGSVFYFIMTGNRPYEELVAFDPDGIDGENMVMELIHPKNEWPSLDGIVCSSVMLHCWNRAYADAKSLIVDQDKCFEVFKAQAGGL
ncbi:kinase-like domain-containing protein [Penicillium angulare]|uniref:EKC/KEOPS complex subunit BUD32 n=1 Tax=Penicillium angulare TaxID=116970 RepID=A0A9W9K557_9EURO|nr:kinase-like domain-containing protein [Penicillium angulare]